jgi:hypothetical protein
MANPTPPFLLTLAQMRRLSPHFPLSHGIPRVDDRWSCPHQTGQAAWVADCAAMNSRGERMRKPL